MSSFTCSAIELCIKTGKYEIIKIYNMDSLNIIQLCVMYIERSINEKNSFQRNIPGNKGNCIANPKSRQGDFKITDSF